MRYVTIGKIINTHGLKGEARIESWSDFNAQRYQPGRQLFLSLNGVETPVTVRSSRMHKGCVLAAFAELPDLTAIEPYKGALVKIADSEREPLPADTYYYTDLIGLQAAAEDGTIIGTVEAVEETSGAQKNLLVRQPDGRTVRIPFVQEFILAVDLAAGQVRIRLQEGLL